MMNLDQSAWVMRAEAAAKIAKARNPLPRLIGEYDISDYSIRKKGDHFESYNTITGEGLFEAQTRTEALADLQEEFAL